MSSQNTTAESIKETTDSAIDSMSKTISSTSQNGAYDDPGQDKNDVAKDIHGNVFKKGDFKDQLNQAATGGLRGEDGSNEDGGVVEKGNA
jgi:hypothetical protein